MDGGRCRRKAQARRGCLWTRLLPCEVCVTGQEEEMGSHFWEATGCHQWHMCSCGFTGASVIGTISLLFRLVCKKYVQRCLQRESEQTLLAMWSPSSVPNFKEKERIADSSLVPVFLLLAQKILNSNSVDPASSSAVHHWLLWVQPRD